MANAMCGTWRAYQTSKRGQWQKERYAENDMVQNKNPVLCETNGGGDELNEC